MTQINEHRLIKSLKQFVDAFNSSDGNISFPIIGFQFVSLDNILNGKMVWWNYLHKSISKKYEEAIEEFTQKENSNDFVKRTLINWEYDEETYWFKDFGGGKIINDYAANYDSVTYFQDESGIERQTADSSEKRNLLNKWELILKNKFCSHGATIWVSIPHKENHGDIVYSSVFCLFNDSVSTNQKKQEIYKAIRNFIIDYVLDLYRKPIEDKLYRVTKEVDVKSFIPKEYSFTGEKKRMHVDQLFKHYTENIQNVEAFIKSRDDASERVFRTYDPFKGFQNTEKYQVRFKKFHEIKNSQKSYFFNHLYGRFLILAYCLVFNITIREASNLLIDCNDNNWWPFDYVQSLFGIKGLKDDMDATDGTKTPNLVFEMIIPNISDQEYKFLLSLCEKFNNSITSEISKIKSNS